VTLQFVNKIHIFPQTLLIDILQGGVLFNFFFLNISDIKLSGNLVSEPEFFLKLM
jgi:hypothetical protein